MAEQSAYRPNVMLAPASMIDRRAEIDNLNDHLEREGLGRPIGIGAAVSPSLAMLPVTADLDDVMAALGRLRETASELAELTDQLRVDHVYRVGTDDRDGKRLTLHASGCRIGHGVATWTPVKQGPPPVGWRPVAEVPGGRRPVVALLDTGVEDHPWLSMPPVDRDDPFCIDAACRGWRPPPRLSAAADEFGRFRGHATFLAGLIHRYAPDAQVLSVEVMDDDGDLAESTAISAVEWLTREIEHGRLTVDVVCMAFGRPKRAGDDSPYHPFRKALRKLAGFDVQLVASAGNYTATTKTYPAAFADDETTGVTSVGSGSAQKPDWFSNRGSWVKEWADGQGVVSTMPLTEDPRVVADGYARWNGTSFAAATHAALLAQEVADNAIREVSERQGQQ